MTTIEFPRVVWEFLAAANSCDRAWLETLFVDDCTLVACGFRASGREAVSAWGKTEVMDAGIALSILGVSLTRDITTLRVQALDHGCVHDCDLEFRTLGRYISSLTISV